MFQVQLWSRSMLCDQEEVTQHFLSGWWEEQQRQINDHCNSRAKQD